MRTIRTPAVLVACLLPAVDFVASWEAHAQPDGAPGQAPLSRFVLIDRDLKAQVVELGGFAGGAVLYIDAQRAERQRPMNEVLALAPPWWLDAAPAGSPVRLTPLPNPSPARSEADTVVGIVELVDGQRLTGWPVADAPGGRAEGRGEALLWNHPRFGRLRIPLDEVSRIEIDLLAPASPAAVADVSPAPAATPLSTGGPPQAITDDEVVLRNGDHVRGLVEEIGSRVIIIAPGAIGGGGTRTEAAIERVREVRLANKRRDPVGTFVWLHDGTVVRMERVESATGGPEADSLSGTLWPGLGAQGRALWARSEMEAMVFDAAKVRPLAALPLKRQEGAPGRRRFERARATGGGKGPPPPLWSRDIQLRGPMTLEWELPRGASAISGVLEMPEEAWAWGDCEVVVALVGAGDKATPLARDRLNASKSRAPLNLVLPAAEAGQRLRVTVEEGTSGAIQDWVDLKRVVVAVR